MSQSTLVNAFNISIAIGFVIPLLSLLAGWLGGIFGAGTDVDVGNGTGGGLSALIPFNLMCLCLFLVVFGAMGRLTLGLMTTLTATILLLTSCFVVAAFFYWALYKVLIKRLKENDASALSFHHLRGRSGEVTLSVSRGSMGTISLQDSTGAAISFRAKIDPCLEDQMPPVIPKGEQVVITEVDAENKLCYISMYISRINENKQTGGNDV